MLDSDLAEVYGVATKRLNEQVKRNAKRFPADFVFRLTTAETALLLRSRSHSATLKRGQNIKHPPYAFTEHGAVMLAAVLNSPVAIEASLKVVRAFVRLRELIARRDGLGHKMTALERRVNANSTDIARIFDVLQELVEPPARPLKRIGFSP
ncbi:MAG: ORF6N domain-containing protein [Elusimicrobia bacterium]|nr:ORF6N domain-containing protein [Elusimicrobiota bacterium]